MNFASKLTAAAAASPVIIETKEDFIAYTGMKLRQVKSGTHAVTQEHSINYTTGNLELMLGAIIADRLPPFFEKNGILFEEGKTDTARNNATGKKTLIISDFESMTKLARMGVAFDGANALVDRYNQAHAKSESAGRAA